MQINPNLAEILCTWIDHYNIDKLPIVTLCFFFAFSAYIQFGRHTKVFRIFGNTPSALNDGLNCFRSALKSLNAFLECYCNAIDNNTVKGNFQLV